MVQHRGRRLERPAMPSRLHARRDQAAARNQNVAGQRTMFSHPGKERWRRCPFLPRRVAGPIALVPICHGYKLQVAGWELGVAGSPLLTPALLFAFCFPARRGHELWSNRIRNRLLQNTIDFHIVLGGQFPSVCFFHTLQLFG
jgi:hypothetical protein